jgi:hypothetical protein
MVGTFHENRQRISYCPSRKWPTHRLRSKMFLMAVLKLKFRTDIMRIVDRMERVL